MPDKQSPRESLIEIAGGLEKLASAIESESQKVASKTAEPSVDYGSLGSETYAGSDALTRFLLT